MSGHTRIEEVTLQALREAIASGILGDYSCAHTGSIDLETWSRQARELHQFAQARGFTSRAHPTTVGTNLIDLIIVRI